jgi:hypothetical protein
MENSIIGGLKVKGCRLIIFAAGAIIAVLAAVVAIAVFKNEIVDFITAATDSVLEKLSGKSASARKKSEYTDYADI